MKHSTFPEKQIVYARAPDGSGQSGWRPLSTVGVSEATLHALRKKYVHLGVSGSGSWKRKTGG